MWFLLLNYWHNSQKTIYVTAQENKMKYMKFKAKNITH